MIDLVIHDRRRRQDIGGQADSTQRILPKISGASFAPGRCIPALVRVKLAAIGRRPPMTWPMCFGSLWHGPLNPSRIGSFGRYLRIARLIDLCVSCYAFCKRGRNWRDYRPRLESQESIYQSLFRRSNCQGRDCSKSSAARACGRFPQSDSLFDLSFFGM